MTKAQLEKNDSARCAVAPGSRIERKAGSEFDFITPVYSVGGGLSQKVLPRTNPRVGGIGLPSIPDGFPERAKHCMQASEFNAVSEKVQSNMFRCIRSSCIILD